MKRFVLGFAFNADASRVLLIEHAKHGKLNGLGGHIEDESPESAMVREFREESGIVSSGSHWRHFARFGNSEWSVECFVSMGLWRELSDVTPSPEGGLVSRYSKSDFVDPKCMPNLKWLIPMAMDVLRGTAESSFLDIRY